MSAGVWVIGPIIGLVMGSIIGLLGISETRNRRDRAKCPYCKVSHDA